MSYCVRGAGFFRRLHASSTASHIGLRLAKQFPSLLLSKALRVALLTIIPLGLAPIAFGQSLTLTPPSGTVYGGDVGVSYNPLFALSATGGTPPYTYSTIGAPSWVSVNSSTGAATGTPTTTGTYTFTTKVVDHAGASQTQSLTFDVAPDVSIVTTSLPNAQLGVPYNVQLQAAGGTPSFPAFGQLYYWSVAIAGSLPPGLSLTSSGSTTSITGTPSGGGGTFSFSLQVTDSDGSWAGSIAYAAFSIFVSGSSSSTAISATPASLSFNYPIGGSVPTAQTISVGSSNPSSGISFNALVFVGSWLSAGPVYGTTPGSESVSVNPSGLVAGTYSGTVRISSPSATNSPLTVTVTLTVSAGATISATPASLAFNYSIGGSVPSGQTISVGSSNPSSGVTFDGSTSGGSWLSLSPTGGTTPATVAVSVNPSGLTAGTYKGAINLVASGASNSPQAVNVTLTITPSPALTVQETHSGFSQGQAGSYTITVTNSATGGPTNGTVSVTDTLPIGLALVSMAGPGWSCVGTTCTRSDPLAPGLSYPSITVNVNVASNAPSQVTNQATVSGGGSASATTSDVTTITASTAPSISSGGVANAASGVAGAVSPGSIAMVRGNFQLSSSSTAPSGPWPTSLGGLSMRFGTVQAPLDYVSGPQVNLQVPWELSGQTQTTLAATANGQTSPAQPVNLTPFAPGIFAMNGQGSGQGAILDPSGKLVDSSNPATAGSTCVSIYCTGLGPVTNQPASGALSPGNPLLAVTATIPTVMIGGIQAGVQFSGLAPGSVGLYQVNVQVPAGVTTDAAVPVVISIGGTLSNTVTIAVVSAPATLTSINPSSSAAGTILTVVIAGVNTSFIQGQTLASLGAGISVGGAPEGQAGPVTVTSSTSAVAQLTVDPLATPGSRAVWVVTDSQIAALNNGFTVQAPPAAPGPLTVVSTSPANGATGVSLTPTVQITFNGPLQESTLNGANVALTKGVRVLPATVGYDPVTYTATLAPSGSLAAGSTYAVTVGPGLTNIAGASLSASYTLSFTTQTLAGVEGTIFGPAGLDPTTLTVVSLGQVSTPQSFGTFSTQVLPEGVTPIMAIVPGRSFGLMAVAIANSGASTTSEDTATGVARSTVRQVFKRKWQVTAATQAAGLLSDLVVNFQTTAESLAFMSTSLFTSVANDATNAMTAIASDPATQKLASDLEAAWSEVDPLSDPTVLADLNAIVSDVLLPGGGGGAEAAYTCSSANSKPPVSPQSSGGVSLNMLDTEFISATLSSGPTLSFKVQSGCATGWLATIAQLNTTPPTGISPGSIQPVYEQNGQLASPGLPLSGSPPQTIATWVPGNSTWMAVEISSIINDLVNWLTNNTVPSPEASVSLPPESTNEQTAYVLRFYSGGVADSCELDTDIEGKPCATTQVGSYQPLPNASTLWLDALILNYLDAGLNYLATVIPFDVLGCFAKTTIFQTMFTDIQNSVGAQPTPSPLGLAGAITTIASDFSAGLNVSDIEVGGSKAFATCVASLQPGIYSMTALDAVLKILGTFAAKTAAEVLKYYDVALDSFNYYQLLNELAFVASPVSTVVAVVNPSLTILPGDAYFEFQQVGTSSSPQTITLENTGQSSVTIQSITVGGAASGDFTVAGICGTITAGGSCTLQITFTPKAVGQRSATLQVSQSVTGSTRSAPLTGIGVEASTCNLSTTALSFSSQAVGTMSSGQSVTVTNSSQTPLAITRIAVAGVNASDFQEIDNCNVLPLAGTTLKPTASCKLTVTFRPTSGGTRSASLQITDNASNSPQLIALTGTGVVVGAPNPVPAITSLSPTSASAGSGPLTLTINGSGFIASSSVTVNGVLHASTFVNANQLTITLIASDLAAAGSFLVVVTNPAPGGGTSNSVNFTVQPGTQNPQPAITSLSPPSAPAGSSPLTLTVSGSGFSVSSTVTFSGVSHAASFVNANQLTISLSASDLATPGSFPVIVTNPPPGGGASNSAVFTVSGSTSGISISPSSVSVPEGAVETFTATVSGGGSVTWSVQEGTKGGTVTSAGIYTAPNSTGTFHVVAISNANPGQTATAAITVIAAVSYATLYSFSGGFESAPLIQGSDGNFYGTTEMVAFKIDPSGNFTQLSTLSWSPDAPISPLIQARDGNFYGTISEGGASGLGSIFRMDASGNVTVMSSFEYTNPGLTGGAWPWAGLIQGRDGNLYGTTYAGGSTSCNPKGYGVPAYGPYGYGEPPWYYGTGCGTVFRMDSTGNVTVLYSFSGQNDGSFPAAPLIQGSDGYFYGTTSAGGTYGVGTVFKMDVSGNLTVLHSFSGADGNGPVAPLVQAADGNLYGTTVGNSSGSGEVFRVDTTGNFTVLHSFSGADGSFPAAPLIQGSDGSFYGTTWAGGDLTCGSYYWTNNYPYPRVAGCGTVFKMDSSGNVTVLHAFAEPPSDGAAPYAGLLLGKDGQLYGTTFSGGTSAYFGTVFRLSVPGSSQPMISALSPSSAITGSSPMTLTINGSGFVTSCSVTFNGVSHAVTFVSSNQLSITLSASDLAASGSFPVVVTNPAGAASNAISFTVGGLSLQGKNFTINGTITVSGKALSFGIGVVAQSGGPDFVLLDNDTSAASGINFEEEFYSGVSVSGNTAVFSGSSLVGTYIDINTSLNLLTITSTTLTIKFTSSAPGSAVTGTVSFSTSSGTIQGTFTGTLASPGLS